MGFYRQQHDGRALWEVMDDAEEEIPNTVSCKKCYDQLSTKEEEGHCE